MSKRDDGGPAYPTARFDNALRDEPVGFYGMSLRDWFAGQALQGFLADSSQRLIAEALESDLDRPLIQDARAKASIVNHQLAAGCFALANAMIAERSK